MFRSSLTREVARQHPSLHGAMAAAAAAQHHGCGAIVILVLTRSIFGMAVGSRISKIVDLAKMSQRYTKVIYKKPVSRCLHV